MNLMTENKRFWYEGAKIFDGEEFVCCTLSIWKKQLVDLLNELHEENQDLKKRLNLINEQILNKYRWEDIDDNTELVVELNQDSKELKELQEENRQLKQFKEDVFNKIDMHLRMLPTARDNEFNEEYGDPSLYSGAIYMLETLKEELQE